MNNNMENNNRLASTIRNNLGYLPTVLLKSIIDNDDLTNNEKLPITITIKTCCLYIDISKLFEDSSSTLNKNEATNSTPFNYTKNLYIPEYYYFFFNRFQEKLISVINNHGGDIIFEALGAYAIWPPGSSDDDDVEEKEDDDENNKNEIINMHLKTIQCALDLQKKASKIDFSNKSLFFPKIGISFGNCTFVIFKTEDGKYEYTTCGDALIDAYDCSQKITKRGQVITNRKMFEDISKYINYDYIGEEGKYLSITSLKNIGNLLQNNKSTVNLIRNNISVEQILNKKEILANFNNHLVSKTLNKYIIDEKWFKEILYMTLLFVRIKMTPKDYEETEKIQKTFDIIYNIAMKYGGIVNKILTDKNGFIYLISFGIKPFKNSENEIRGVLAAFEICKKLKRKKIVPYIGITSGLSFYGLIGNLGGRREVFIISGLLFFGLLSMEKAEVINENKSDKFEDDNILLDENTMIMIDYKIPTKFWKKLPTKLGIDIYLFIPQKIESLLNEHYTTNLFPLIGTHLHDKEDLSYENNLELSKEDNIIFLEEEHLRDIVKIMNDFTSNRTNIKLISITSISGCGKTLLLKKCLDSYFDANQKLKETLINNKLVKEYPFIINANLTFVINSDILINCNTKEDYRGFQFILNSMFNIINKDDEGKQRIKKLFNQNKSIEDYVKKIIFSVNESGKNEERYNDFDSFKEDTFNLTKENKKKIHQFFINIIKEYKKIINNIYRDVLYETKIFLPLIIIIDDINICDELSIEFIKYYLSNDNNDFLLITTNSIPIYPPYIYLEEKQKDPFYEIKNNNKSIAKFKIDLLDTDEKKIIFVKSILKELKGIKISFISSKILTFLIKKTIGGNPFFIMRLILIIVEQNYCKIENEKLMENEAFERMLKDNDFTEFTVSRIIQKKIGEIICNELDEEEICLLKFASLFGDLFELSQLKQVILIENTSIFISYLRKGDEQYIYKKLRDLESKFIIELMEDLDIKHKYVICKFSLPFLREILYQRIPSEQRNQLHYIIGKMTKLNLASKYGKMTKYLSDTDSLEMLKNHLKFSEITIHENFLKGTLSNSEIVNDNLNINNLKTLLTQEICSKISSIKINDDKNNMIKAGYIYKKSDGKLTWEYRYFVLTTNRVIYYYNEEDYNKEGIPPLGIFYLQNLFSVTLLRDGYVGGKKNIFSLSVNEWIKKGNYMTPRIYYLSIEDREELYKWIITFNILKIKAFYDSYSQNFGYVNFPLYNRERNENNFKAKKNTKFNYELYKDIYLKTNRENIENKKKNNEDSFIYNNYFLREENDKKKEDDLKISSMANDVLSKLKLITKYTLPIFLSNIQLSLQKTVKEFNNLKPNLPYELEFKIPKYLKSFKEEFIKEEIEIIDTKIENSKKKTGEKKIDFTPQERKYFKQFHINIIHPKENKIYFKIKNIKRYISDKPVEKTKYRLFDNDNKKVNLKSEWNRYFEEDKKFFKNCQEEKIDTTDNLRYTDFVEKYDASGNLKERPSLLYRQSISVKVNPESNKNTNENPILDNLISRQNETYNDDIQKNEQSSDVEEDKENDFNEKQNENLNIEENDEQNKENNQINNIEIENEINEKKDSEKEDLRKSKKSKKNNKKDKIIKKEQKDRPNNNNIIEKNSEDTLERKEKLNREKKLKKETNLSEFISDKNKNEKKQIKISNKNENKLNPDNFDFVKVIEKSQNISKKNFKKKLINSKPSSEKTSKKDEDNIKMQTENVNSLFSFGNTQNNIIEINQNSQKYQTKENNDTYSFNYQDSSMVNSSKSYENDSNKIINSKSNERESPSDENENNSIKEKNILNLMNKSKETIDKKGKEKERKNSFNSNNKNNIMDTNNINSINTEKMSDNNEINKINESKNNNTSMNSMNSNSKPKINMKYDYLNELSPNRKYIINIKLNNLNKEKNKADKNNNETNEINSNKKGIESDAFDKLRDMTLSLDNEKSLSSYFKRINKENAIKNETKEISRNNNGNDTKYSQEFTIQSTNSNYDNIFYPNVYYINDNNKLHTKTHVSMLFTKLKNQNIIYNQEENN